MNRWTWIGLPALMLLLVNASPATASTLGSTNQGTNACPTNTLFWGTGPSYTVPSGGGLITSMSFNTATTSGHFSVKLLRTAGTTVTVVGTTPQQTITAAGTRTVSGLHISATPGDQIGVWTPDGPACYISTSSFGYGSTSTSSADPAVGSSFPVTTLNTGIEITVSATLEPDADHDNFGDLSQDACPSDPALHTAPCTSDLALTVAAIPSKIVRGGVSAVIARVS